MRGLWLIPCQYPPPPEGSLCCDPPPSFCPRLSQEEPLIAMIRASMARGIRRLSISVLLSSDPPMPLGASGVGKSFRSGRAVRAETKSLASLCAGTGIFGRPKPIEFVSEFGFSRIAYLHSVGRLGVNAGSIRREKLFPGGILAGFLGGVSRSSFVISLALCGTGCLRFSYLANFFMSQLASSRWSSLRVELA